MRPRAMEVDGARVKRRNVGQWEIDEGTIETGKLEGEPDNGGRSFRSH